MEGRKNRKGVSDVGRWAGNYDRGFELGTTYHRNDPGQQSGHPADGCMANPASEEPDALMRARPDLWEPWAGNRPGPPGPPRRNAPCLLGPVTFARRAFPARLLGPVGRPRSPLSRGGPLPVFWLLGPTTGSGTSSPRVATRLIGSSPPPAACHPAVETPSSAAGVASDRGIPVPEGDFSADGPSEGI